MAGRALVLGSGGIVGIAWEIGVLAGLAEHGVDLGEADLVIGTSAGAVVGASSPPASVSSTCTAGSSRHRTASVLPGPRRSAWYALSGR